MSVDITERNLEDVIEAALLAHGPDHAAVVSSGTVKETSEGGTPPASGGYRKRLKEHYDRALCLDPEMLLAFIYATQPKEWDKLQKANGADATPGFLRRVRDEVAKHGTLHVLRKGVKDRGRKFRLFYARPSSGLNDYSQQHYLANIFSVIRQTHFSEKNEKSLDMVLFLNGLPIFTVELKNHFTGQTVKDAITQYRQDRDPMEPLFAFGRCLAHFAVDPDLVYMTTRLEGHQTRFLPFNKGRNGGAGNAPADAPDTFATAYLWEVLWSKDSVLDLVQNFAQDIEEEDERGQKTGVRHVIFPRYHQLDAVRRLVADARAAGAGHRYLIQHSAGSGKSNTIAWLAHQLSSLHDAGNKRVFDSIIVITDRRVLDRQLRQTVRGFEQVAGVVNAVEHGSIELKQALEHGSDIIITTLQKFPFVVSEIGALPGQRFAVIVDEAHSSQSGESTKSLKAVLSVASLDEAIDEDEEDTTEDWQDRLAEAMKNRKHLPNVSTFAFTATPKRKTLELFGTKDAYGSFMPFSLYSMRQAIEEGFILDVLENYTTFTAYWNLLKKIKDDPHYEKDKAVFLLKSYVDLHEHTIAKKVGLIVDHFDGQVAHRIGGKAKAMIVTRSRLHAVRYKLAVDRYLQEKGCPYRALIAFSGEVHDKAVDERYTEPGMNSVAGEHITEAGTAEVFKRDEFRFLIVANKFQTGFDQPLLHTMYVDKKLGGVNAVQTLSRLNRVHAGKDETMVLDFANKADEIQKAFQPYYEQTLLSEGTDPNVLYDVQARLLAFGFYTDEDVADFARIYADPKGTQAKLYKALAPVVERYNVAQDEKQEQFRGALNDYVRLYAFLSQIIAFVDAELEALYQFARLLVRHLPVTEDTLPVEVQQNINMDSFRIQKKSEGKIGLARGEYALDPIGAEGAGFGAAEMEALSQIIQVLNQRFGTDFTEADKVGIKELEQRLADDASLQASVQSNSQDNARLTFDLVVKDRLQDMFSTHFKLYKQVADDPAFRKELVDWLFQRYVNRPGPCPSA